MTSNGQQLPIAMRQRWSELVFVHWALDPKQLEPHLPKQLTLDTFDGRAYIGIVAFRMNNVALAWFAPMPGASDTLECNLRTYVRRSDSTDPGIWFFSLDASNPVMTALARARYALPYYYARMSMMQLRNQQAGSWHKTVHYESHRVHPGAPQAHCVLEYEPSLGHVAAARFGSLEEFLMERYRLYSMRRGLLTCANVRHTPYQIEPVRLISVSQSLTDAAGIHCPQAPPLVHFAREVLVAVEPLIAVSQAGPTQIAGPIPGIVPQPA